MALALEARAMKDDIMLGDTPKAVKRRHRVKDVETRGRLWKHSTLSDIDGLMTSEEIADCFCFTLVRNPWDRMVSYYHWLRDQRFEHSAVKLAQTLDFDGFVSHPQTEASFRASPASHYMTDALGINRADAFIRLEHLDRDLEPVQNHLGFALNLGHSNASKRKLDWRSYYSAETAEKVKRICAEDVAFFGYECNL